MPRPINADRGGVPSHVHIETRQFIAGEPVIIDGHTFLVQAMDNESWGTVSAPHPGPGQDAFNIVNRVSLKLEHAPWRGCPAAEPEASPYIQVPRDAFNALVKVAEYVSYGRSAVGHQPDGAPYPDALARRALGTLGEVGLHKVGGERDDREG